MIYGIQNQLLINNDIIIDNEDTINVGAEQQKDQSNSDVSYINNEWSSTNRNLAPSTPLSSNNDLSLRIPIKSSFGTDDDQMVCIYYVQLAYFALILMYMHM